MTSKTCLVVELLLCGKALNSQDIKYVLLYQGYTLTDQLLLCEAFTKFAYIIYHYTVVIKYAFP